MILLVFDLIWGLRTLPEWRRKWRRRLDHCWGWFTRADARPVFGKFRDFKQDEIHRLSTGTISGLVDKIIVLYAWRDARSTLNARLISPRYMRHPGVMRALCYVPARIAMEQTILYYIWWLRNESTQDPDHLQMITIKWKLNQKLPGDSNECLHRISNTIKYPTDIMPGSKCTFDVSDAYLPRIEEQGPGTITLWCVETRQWETLDYRTHVHWGEPNPVYKILSSKYTNFPAGYSGLVNVICQWKHGQFTCDDDHCLLDLMYFPTQKSQEG